MQRRRLTVELLEDRLAPATFGTAWPDPLHLTLSFAPNGTTADGLPEKSNLFATLNPQQAAQWQGEILRAFQTWAAATNINIALAEDSGAPFGSTGPVQGDARFGDIRIGTYPLAADVIAVAMPFDFAAGTWSGDVRINPVYFGAGDLAGTSDLFTVMLHEAGHVFGLPHASDNPDDPNDTSVMFEGFRQSFTTLSERDRLAIQALYGVRQPDAFEGRNGNDTCATAAALNMGDAVGSSDTKTLRVDGDITTLLDRDFYSFNPTGNLDSLTITVHTNGISLLMPSLRLYDGAGKELGFTTSTGPLGDDIVLRFDMPQQGQKPTSFVLEVGPGSEDVFGIGGYELQIDTHLASHGGGPQSPSGPQNDDLHSNDTLNRATNLAPRYFRGDARFAITVAARLSDASDVDYYTFRTPQSKDNQPSVLTATVWTNGGSGFQPTITLYDADGQRVAAEVLVAEGGTFTVQVPNAPAHSTYFLAIAEAAGATGDYDLAIDFSSQAAQLETLVDAVTVQSDTYNGGTLTVSESRLFHFVLSAADGAGQLNVYDSGGAKILTMDVADGQVRSATTVLLPESRTEPAEYTFVFTPTGSTAATYTLKVIGISDPIGPDVEDTTLGGHQPPTSGLPFFWQAGYFAYVVFGNPPSTGGGSAPPAGNNSGPVAGAGGSNSGPVANTDGSSTNSGGPASIPGNFPTTNGANGSSSQTSGSSTTSGAASTPSTAASGTGVNLNTAVASVSASPAAAGPATSLGATLSGAVSFGGSAASAASGPASASASGAGDGPASSAGLVSAAGGPGASAGSDGAGASATGGQAAAHGSVVAGATPAPHQFSNASGGTAAVTQLGGQSDETPLAWTAPLTSRGPFLAPPAYSAEWLPPALEKPVAYGIVEMPAPTPPPPETLHLGRMVVYVMLGLATTAFLMYGNRLVPVSTALSKKRQGSDCSP